MSDYVPIDCADYDVYEIAIMRRQRLRLCWRAGDGQAFEETVTPKDLRTEHHAEFLLAETSGGEPLKLRLDAITAVQPI